MISIRRPPRWLSARVDAVAAHLDRLAPPPPLLARAIAKLAGGVTQLPSAPPSTLVAAAITERLHIPTIGIGAGAQCDGQVLVYHDVLGLFDRVQPTFVKLYARLGPTIIQAFREYRDDVLAGRFPTAEHTYAMSAEELEAFQHSLEEPSL